MLCKASRDAMLGAVYNQWEAHGPLMACISSRAHLELLHDGVAVDVSGAHQVEGE